jgi:tRNA(adenine34) deaminase
VDAFLVSGKKKVSWTYIDINLMQVAIAEAEKAMASNEVPVGAIVTWSGEIIGKGFNRIIQDSDPSAHAEVIAIRNAAANQKNYRLKGATVYVTLEPCAMCVGAMIQARIQRLVFGAYDPQTGAVGSVLDLSNIKEFNHRFEINGGLLEAECSAMLKDFFAEKR